MNGSAGHPISGKLDWLRTASSLLAMALGVGLGGWVALLAHSWITDSFPAENVGAAWGTGVAAATALWKAFTDTVDSLRGALRYATRNEDKFDHVKAIFNLATISFGIVLGLLGLIKGFPDKKDPEKPEVQLVYVVSYQGKEAPSFLVSPTLVFASARLRDPDTSDRSAASSSIEPSDFSSESVSLSPKQIESAANLVSKLARDCTHEGAEDPLELVVYGFANDLPIVNKQKANRKDSDILNMAVANFRGKALYTALTSAASRDFPQLSEELVIRWTPWRSLSKMRSVRDNKVFRNIQITVSPAIDHRSAVLVVTKPGTCPSLISPDVQSTSGSDAQPGAPAGRPASASLRQAGG